jgi:predicted unusual protein kinase regulating ubiquinone biosynthesis (AarF/ABC1/UbiB family)
MLKSRYRRIILFFGRVILSVIWWDIILTHIGFRRLSRRTRPNRYRKIAAAFRGVAIAMGGVMIKLGQFLSSRLDVLPREITDELSGLQDEVRPVAFEDIQKVIESEFQAPLQEYFMDFEETPIAAASIGQVHCARMRQRDEDPEEEAYVRTVVVKVQRPHIQEIVEIDLSALYVIAGWLKYYRPISKHVNVTMLLGELDRSIHEEMDYLAEGKNAETFAVNFEKRTEIRVPHVFWKFTTKRVLTLEDVQGIKITDYEKIDAAGIDRAEVAHRLFDTYLKQIFEDRFFHADPHPGNLFVLPIDSEGNEKPEWKLVFVDFGMVGNITVENMEGLRELLMSIAMRDAPRLIGSYQKLRVLLPGADLELLQKASMRVFDQMWGKTTSEMMEFDQTEAIEFAREFEGLIYEMPFQMPENFILLGRCIGILSGMCTGLNKDFNIWARIGPYAQNLVTKERGSGIDLFLKEAGSVLLSLVNLPKRTENLFNRIEQGRLEVRTPDLSQRITHLEHSLSRMVGAVLFFAFLLAGVNLYLGGFAYLAGGSGVTAAIVLIWIIFSRR